MFSPETHDAGREWVLSQILSQYVVGFLGKSDGAGGWTFFVPGRPGMVYCRIWQNDGVTIHEVTNMVAPLEPNLRVWMRYFNGELMVEFADAVAARSLYANNVGAAGVPPHVSVQNDDLVIGQRFLPGRVGVSDRGGMYVHVSDFDHFGGHWYGAVYDPGSATYNQTVNDLDLSAYIPATSGHVGWVGVGLDASTNSLFAAAGDTIYGNDDPNTLIENVGAPSPYDIPMPAGSYPLGAVALASTTTAVNASTLFVDLRLHLDSSGGADFDVILTDADGNGLSDADGNVLIGA